MVPLSWRVALSATVGNANAGIIYWRTASSELACLPLARQAMPYITGVALVAAQNAMQDRKRTEIVDGATAPVQQADELGRIAVGALSADRGAAVAVALRMSLNDSEPSNSDSDSEWGDSASASRTSDGDDAERSSIDAVDAEEAAQ